MRIPQRRLLALAVTLLSLTGACAPAQPPAPARTFDKVVLLSIDTLRADYLDVYTPGLGTSPRLEQFAQEAQVFEDAITQATSTLPSHMSVMYSIHTFVHRAYLSSQPVVGVPSPVGTLAEAGYATAAYVGGGQLRPQFGLDRGFDSYEVVNTRNINAETRGTDRLDDLLVAASRFLRQHGDEPFFLFLHTYEPHYPYDPPPEFLEPFAEGLKNAPGLGIEAPLHEYVDDRGVPREAWLDDRRRAKYAAEVRYVDDFFGRLMRRLEAQGLADDTLVVVVSDHGESLGERGIIGHNLFYTEQLRVPLLMRVPGMDGARHDDPVQLVDVMPTLFALLGQEAPYPFMGQSLVEVLRGTPLDPERVRVAENKGRGAVLRGPWKVVFPLQSTDGMQLFRLDEDPGELTDRFGERPQLAMELRGLYEQLVSRNDALLALFPHGDESSEDLDPETLEELRALGYIQ